MSSSEAGPSSAPASQPEVLLSVEPVHIYTDTNPGQLFERENKLNDIAADGTNIFATRKPAGVQLSEDVRRLWAERGDFSKFRSSELLLRANKRSRDADGESNSSSSDDDDEENEGGNRKEGGEEGEGLVRKEGEVVGGTIIESEFVQLRNKVLASLDVAHFNSIHAHQLLGMLIKQHRSSNAGQAAAAAAGAAGAAGRMGSPAPSLGAASNRSGPSTNTKPQAPLGIFSHLTHAGNREEEFILDPLSIALSRTSLNTSVAVRRDISSDHNDEEDEDADDEVLQDPTSVEYGLRQARRELEGTEAFRENKLREFKVVLETKRNAIRNAAELLGSAAAELRRGQAANRERWRSLIGLHGRGWGLTPGRPLIDVERFGATDEQEDDDAGAGEGSGEVKKKVDNKKKNKEKKPAGLQGFGTPIVTSDGKIKDEGARDAWIGFGLPEAPLELRRRSIAYWADTSSLPPDADTKAKLVFPDRMYRRLRVRFVLWPSTNNAGSGEGRMEWTSDAPSSPATKEEPKVAGQILDSELQSASREASDELVFGDVVAQARQLPPSFGVRLTSSSVRIVLTKRLDLVVELVPTTPSTEEKEGKVEARYAAHASLLLAFLRLGPLRKYQAFVSATAKGREGDAAARAAAIKAAALAVPKKSTAAQQSAAQQKESSSAGKGIGAGGRASSAALAKLDTLGPVVVGLHYWSFVHRLGSCLQQVQRETEAKAKAKGKGIKVKVELVPVTPSSRADAGGLKRVEMFMRMLGSMVDATRSSPLASPSATSPRGDEEAALHSIYPTATATTGGASQLDALRGYAKVWVQDERKRGSKLVCTLTFAQPSLLSVQFAATAAARTKLTTKPLAVDLDTLGSLLTQQMAHYT